tara:strand:+ start:1186 stop:1812 length:627 start_codon:yes stop_codon:yes gene_type:complete
MPTKRYDKTVKFSCKTCGREGLNKTDMHHIISQGFIKKRASRRQLEYLANGILSKAQMKRMKDSEIANVLIKKNPRNIVEMCKKCHRMTTSYLQYLDYQMGTLAPKPKRTTRRRKRRGRVQCEGYTLKGKKCKHKGVYKDGYCNQHLDQLVKEGTKENSAESIPGLHDEGRLEEHELEEIWMWKELGMKPDTSMFSNKSTAWKKQWLN